MASIARPDCCKRASICAAGMLAFTLATGAQAEIFKCTDTGGKVNFSDKPCATSETSESITINTPPPLPDAADRADKQASEWMRQRKISQAEKISREIRESKSEINRIRSDNYDPAKCKHARAQIFAIKKADPVGYSVSMEYLEYKNQVNLYCGTNQPLVPPPF